MITIAKMIDPNTWESPYILKILDNFEKELSDEYNFIISRINTTKDFEQYIECIIKGKKNILVLLSDERGIRPPLLDQLHLVFRTYSNKKWCDNNKKIFPIPCGYCMGHKNSYYKEEIKKPLVDREYDIFYSGQIGYSREKPSLGRLTCTESLNAIKHKFKSIVRITDGFAEGYSLEEYYSLMRNSKIAIVPHGVMIPESFRYFEAFESNCIVITSYPKNDVDFNLWFYETSPAIFIDSWQHDLNENMIRELLTAENLKKYETKNKEYFDNSISPKAVAEYMLRVIKDAV